jgi:ribosome biogenesis GTPase / thiamine phosphate phosphatase
MLEFDFLLLHRIGFSQLLANNLAAMKGGDTTPSDWISTHVARITELHRETIRVHDGNGTQSARQLPKLHRDLNEQSTALAVGDWVVIGISATDERWLLQRIEPINHIVRRDGSGQRHPVVSNIDTALLVMGLDGDFNVRRLERFLALARGSEVVPIVVLTKADLCNDIDLKSEEVRLRIGADIALFALDGRDPNAALCLAPYCTIGQTLVLLGSSGAGKSTLTNSLIGQPLQDTGIIRAADSKGKHTTTARSLHIIPDGACIIDTPGVRTLQPDVDEATLTASFEDIQRLATTCKFTNCSHEDEPGCSVRAGVAADRLKNYQKLLRETRRETMTPLDRQKVLAGLKVKARAYKIRDKSKY